MRLYDLLKSKIKDFPEVRVIDGSNVLEYSIKDKSFLDTVGENNENLEFQGLDIKDIPNLAPPFNSFFIEMDINVLPNNTAKDFLRTFSNSTNKIGFLFTATKDPSMKKSVIDAIQKLGYWKSVTTPPYWILQCSIYLGDSKESIIDSWITANKDGSRFMVNEDDIVFREFNTKFDPFVQHEKMITESLMNSVCTTCWMFLSVAFLTISFMHCKNVQLSEEKMKRQERRERERKGFQTKYHVLQIDPMKEVLRKQGNIETNGLKKALHICRGHFKTYTEKGLFGKHKGTFWVGQHVKGNKAEGEVLKDYHVKV
jgi:hypothetical protein